MWPRLTRTHTCSEDERSRCTRYRRLGPAQSPVSLSLRPLPGSLFFFFFFFSFFFFFFFFAVFTYSFPSLLSLSRLSLGTPICEHIITVSTEARASTAGFRGGYARDREGGRGMGLKPWRNALHQRGDWENARALHARVFGWISGFRVADISLLLSRSRLRLVRSFSSLSLFLFLFVSLTSLCPLSQANYLLVRYQIPPVLPVISCPVLPCSSALSSLFSPSCREILSNSSTRGSLSLFFFFDSPRHFSFHRIVQLILFHYYVAQIL